MFCKCFALFTFAIVLCLGIKPVLDRDRAEVKTKATTTATDTISLPDTLVIVQLRKEFGCVVKQLKATTIDRDRLRAEVIRLSGIVSDTVHYQSWSDKTHLITRQE